MAGTVVSGGEEGKEPLLALFLPALEEFQLSKGAAGFDPSAGRGGGPEFGKAVDERILERLDFLQQTLHRELGGDGLLGEEGPGDGSARLAVAGEEGVGRGKNRADPGEQVHQVRGNATQMRAAHGGQR